MPTKTVSTPPKPLKEYVAPALRKLEKEVAGACLEPEVAKELQSRVQDAAKALRAGEEDRLQTALDGFILTVRRRMGSEISLRKAFELVDVALLDAARYVSTPGHVYKIARGFARDSERIEGVCRSPLDITPRPLGDGVEITQKAMTDAIRSYRVPPAAEKRLIQLADSMAEMALARDPANQRAFISAVCEFQDILIRLQGQYITTQNTHHLLGLVIFGAAAAAGTWVCWIPLTWKAQVLIAIGAAVVIIVGGVLYIFYTSVRASLAHKSIMRKVDDTTSTAQEIDDAVAAELEVLDEDDIRELIDGLTQQLDGVSKEVYLSPREMEAKRARIRKVLEKVRGSLEGESEGEGEGEEGAGD